MMPGPNNLMIGTKTGQINLMQNTGLLELQRKLLTMNLLILQSTKQQELTLIHLPKSLLKCLKMYLIPGNSLSPNAMKWKVRENFKARSSIEVLGDSRINTESLEMHILLLSIKRSIPTWWVTLLLFKFGQILDKSLY